MNAKIAAADVDAVVRQMRHDWNTRASEDARFYIACGRRNQEDGDFAAHAAEVIRRIRNDFAWLPPEKPEGQLRILEIGCGIGRLMAHLADECGEIHGVDISEEMVRQGRRRLAHVPHAHFHHAVHSDLRAFVDESFDVVYSYAVLQHIPDAAIALRYLDEAARVLRPGGVLTIQVNTLPIKRERHDTWAGAVLRADKAAARCHGGGLRIRTLEGVDTQYTWITAQKAASRRTTILRLATLGDIVASDGTADLLAARDAVHLQVRLLPSEACDVTELSLRSGSAQLTVCRIGVPDTQRERDLEALVPDDVTPGADDLVLYWRGKPVSEPARVTFSGPLGPGARVVRVTDGQELSRDNVSSCGWVKLWLADWSGGAEDFAAWLGPDALPFHLHCDNARLGLWQVNLQLPYATPPGRTTLIVQLRAGEAVSFPLLIEADRP